MSWYKKSNSEIILYHTSEMPYYIDDEGAIICTDNFLTEEKKQLDNYIILKGNRKIANRQSAVGWFLKPFPAKIMSKKIISIHNKPQRQHSSDDLLHLAVLRPRFVKRAKQNDIFDIIETYDKSYYVSRASSSNEKTREICNIVDDSICCSSWHSAVLSLVNGLCCSSQRKKNWTKNIPDLVIDIYGISSIKDLDRLHKAIEDFKLLDKIEISTK